MYAYEIPPIVVSVDILDEQIQVIAQVYHAYESKFITKYKVKRNAEYKYNIFRVFLYT